MKKLILIGCALVVVVVAAIVFFGISNLGPIITQAVNTYGPKITQTEVRLGDAGVSLLSGEVKLEDFLLGNPKGFQSPQAMKVGRVYVDLDEKSLTGNPIVIDRIEVDAPEITYERAGRDDNFNALLRNVKQKSSSGQSGGAAKQTGQDADAGGGKKLLIRSLIIKDGRVNLTAKVLAGKTITAELPYIELKDVGGQKAGVTPAKAFNLILAALYKQIQSPDVTAALSKGLEDVGVTVKGISLKGIDDQSKQKVEEVKDRVKGLLGN
ncbi:MAG: AsmA family protein [Desulfobacterales bacterium]|nr:AsmA family protein [Desulfobacterales bacterium]